MSSVCPRPWRSLLSIAVDVTTLAAIGGAGFLFLTSGRPDSTPAAGGAGIETLVGSVMPSVSVRDSGHGRDTLFTAPGTNTLVLVFRTDCPVCGVQKPEWNELARRASGVGWRTVALTPERITSEVAAYFALKTIETFQVSDPSRLGQLGVTGVPATIVVTAKGRIGFGRVGLLGPDGVDVVKAMFDE